MFANPGQKKLVGHVTHVKSTDERICPATHGQYIDQLWPIFTAWPDGCDSQSNAWTEPPGQIECGGHAIHTVAFAAANAVCGLCCCCCTVVFWTTNPGVQAHSVAPGTEFDMGAAQRVLVELMQYEPASHRAHISTSITFCMLPNRLDRLNISCSHRYA